MNWDLFGKGVEAASDSVNTLFNPVSTIGNLINNKKNRGLRQKELDENQRQFDLSNLLKKAEMQQSGSQFDRSKNMSAIDMLANQRAGAMQQFGRRALKDSFFKG